MTSPNKTLRNTGDVAGFLNNITHETRRSDSFTVLALMQKITGKTPTMWGTSIVGFDQYHYRYESGREGDMCMIGFSPRANALTLYVMPDGADQHSLLNRLGKHKTGKSCLYIKNLADIDLGVLESLIREAYTCMQQTYA